MNCLHHYDNGRDAPEVWNRIRNNDPSLTDLVIDLFGTPTPSFYQNLAKDLQDNSNITHLTIYGEGNIKYIPNVFQPIFESSKFITTLEIDFWLSNTIGENRAKFDDVFDSLIKSKNNKITKLRIHVEDGNEGPLTKFLSMNIMENQMLKLILQQKMGTEAASKISDELFPQNSIKEFELVLRYTHFYEPLLDAIGNNRFLESLRIDSCYFDQVDFNFKLTRALENILSNNKALKNLHLAIDDIDLQDLKKIAMAIQKSPSLESFRFHTNLAISSLNQEHIEDNIRKLFAKISNKLLLKMSYGSLYIEAYGYKKSDPNA